jgi:tryptophanyl-tRNA synthetase
VNAMLDPVRARFAEMQADPAYVEKKYREGADKALAVGAPTLAAAKAAIGLT